MIKCLISSIFAGILLVSCAAKQTSTLTPTIEGQWQGLPIMQNAVESQEPSTVGGYLYTVNANLDAAMNFYLTAMETAGWQLLGKGDLSNQDFKAVALWYAKGDQVISVQIWERNNMTYIALLPEQ